MIVRDAGKTQSVLFSDGSALRDDSGKVVAREVGSEDDSYRLSLIAGQAMSGRKVLLDLDIQDVANPQTVAEFGIPEGEFVADIASRVRFIQHGTGVFYAEKSLDLIKLAIPDLTAAGGHVAEINPSWTPTSFVTQSYALMAKLPRLVLGNADFPLLRRATIFLCEALKLQRESRVATQLTTSANWASANRQTVAATHQWNGGASASPIDDLFAALLKSNLPANLLVMPENVAQYFFFNTVSTGIRDYVQAGGQLPRIVFARQKQEFGSTPSTPAAAYIWAPNAAGSNNSVALLRDPGDQDRIPSATTFRWLGDGKDGREVAGMLVRTFWSQRDDSTYVTVSHYDYEAMPDNTVGAIIVNATQ